jgi:thiol:disulfide interchange protein DsbD
MAVVTMLMLAAGMPVLAADGKPAKKDSPARLQPKQVTWTTSVTPVEAKPGQTVTFQATAKLEPSWHIYAQAETQPESGPRSTQFDLFDTGGFKVAGKWEPSKKPTTKKDPAFPELESVSYFEDEVTWSISLQVPTDAELGQKTIRCQAYYQVCSGGSCSVPGRWTLPGATVTVVAGGAPAAKAAPAETPKAEAARAQPATPDRKINPKQAQFTARVEPAEARPGQAVAYLVTAKIEPSWHIFATTHEGAEKTTFDLFDPAGLEPSGDWKASKEPIARTQDLGTGPEPLQYFEDEVTWSLPLKVPADATPGSRTIRGQIAFQVCSDKACTTGRLTLPDVTLAVASAEPASAPAVVASIPPAKGEESPTPKAEAPPTPTAEVSPKATAGAPPKAPANQVERTLQQGIVPFLLLSAGAGLLALVMPCVWPMVPITVNFFVKQGQAKGGRGAKGLAITYCLSIIGIFTLVGVAFSAVFGASAAQNLATSFWLNAFVAALFLAFGLSLLGLFEFRLPSFLLNASAQGESRGGLVGVIFMALTLTITSFTCTFPVVGGLLVMAAGGSYFYPILGLATFATVLALPFFLLALAPGLLSKMPRSGDWMNAVKVVGGLVEVGAAFKFLNNAELALGTVPEDCWFNAPTVLTAWVVLLFVCGIYLLGLFRTDHDHDAVKVGPMRLMLGALFVFLGLFLTPALFGRPPRGQIWDRLIVGLLPPDVESLKAPAAVGGGEPAGGAAVAASSSKPEEAIRQQKSFHGVPWGMSYEAALERAKAEKRPVLIDFTGVFCANCRQMEQAVMPRPEVVERLKQFVTVQLYTDTLPIKSISEADKERLAGSNQELELKLARDTTNPFYVVLSPEGDVLETIGGYREPPVFVDFLDRALRKHQGGGKVAQADLGGK